MPAAAHATLERMHPRAGVGVLHPHLTVKASGFHDDHIRELQALIASYLRKFAIDDYCLWFYTPMAVPPAAELTPRAIMYDCMDELPAFRNAPRQLIQRGNALFKLTDLVFTGAMSLFESKQSRHSRVHCFPSSVDAAHFARPASRAPNARPRLGYFGVFDERSDLGLVDALAAGHPEWLVEMVGPVVKSAGQFPKAGLPSTAPVTSCSRTDASDPVWVASEVDMPYAYLMYDMQGPRGCSPFGTG